MSLFEGKASLSDVSARVDQAEALNAQSDMRLAAILNALEIPKTHGGHRNWSDGQANALQATIKICDQIADGFEPALVAALFEHRSSRA